MQEDPIWGSNLYLYVFANPLNLVDPSGLESKGNETYLYQKVSSTGEHLKFGITNNPATRYTANELAGGKLVIIAKGPRTQMLGLERELHSTLPLGPEERQLQYVRIQNMKGLRGLGGTLNTLGVAGTVLNAYTISKQAEETCSSLLKAYLDLMGIRVKEDML